MLFIRAGLDDLVKHIDGDIRNLGQVEEAFRISRPNNVFRLAAQALVHESYRDLKTYEKEKDGFDTSVR